MGSIIIATVKTETFPIETVVHAYRGGSTEEKTKVLYQYSEKKFEVCDNLRWGNLDLEKKLLNG